MAKAENVLSLQRRNLAEQRPREAKGGQHGPGAAARGPIMMQHRSAASGGGAPSSAPSPAGVSEAQFLKGRAQERLGEGCIGLQERTEPWRARSPSGLGRGARTKDAIFNVADLAQALAHDEHVARVKVTVRDPTVVEKLEALRKQRPDTGLHTTRARALCTASAPMRLRPAQPCPTSIICLENKRIRRGSRLLERLTAYLR